MQDVVDVGRHDQALYRQAHLRCDMAGEDIAEIARRDAECHLAVGPAQLQRSGEIIDHLRHQPRPVDRIDRADPVGVGHVAIGEDALYHRLRVVEAAIDRDVVDIGRAHGGHLAALDIADAALGMQHEYLDPVEPRHRIDRGASRIAAGCPDDGQAAILAREELLEQQAEQLQRYVLEGERGAMEQFEQPLPLVELGQRGHGRMGEAAIGLGGQFAQPLGRQAIADEGLHHPRGQFAVGQTAHRGDFVMREARPLCRDIEPAIAGQTGERDAGEIERRSAAAGGDIFHRDRRLAGHAGAGKQAAL